MREYARTKEPKAIGETQEIERWEREETRKRNENPSKLGTIGRLWLSKRV